MCCQTLAKLERFKKSISSKLSAPSDGDPKGNDEDDLEWMANRLTFIPDSSEKVYGHHLILQLGELILLLLC